MMALCDELAVNEAVVVTSSITAVIRTDSVDTEDSVFVGINILTAALIGIHSGTVIAPSSVIFSIAFGAHQLSASNLTSTFCI